LYPQSIANVLVADKPPLDSISNFQAGLDEIKNSLGDDGRVLVRYSGTESKIRLLAEGRTQLLANYTLDSRLTLARSNLNLIDNKQAT
ncbi:MAG: phosphoglucosamine mutase, partial [Opitutae bacterium]